MVISIAGCNFNEVAVSHNSKYYIDKSYSKMKKQLKNDGFNNIHPKYVKDVYEESKVGTIKEISIDGDRSFEKDEKYKKDSKIKIVVHDIKDMSLPLSSDETNGKNVKDVQTEFENKGFSNIITENLRDLTTRENDQVIENVLVDKQSKFNKKKLFPANVEIIIKYHGIEQKCPPISSKKAKGKNFKDIVKKFEKSNFSNITVKKIEDLITGVITSDGEVEKVTIDGKKYDTYTKYDIDSPIVISYHTFKKTEEEMKTENTTEPNNTTVNENNDFTAYKAWTVLKRYGEQIYPYGFKVHNLYGVINEERIDSNTWFLKAKVTIKNQYGVKRDTIVEARVSCISPYVNNFYVS